MQILSTLLIPREQVNMCQTHNKSSGKVYLENTDEDVSVGDSKNK